MLFFIDGAVISEIKEACSWGVIKGVTTNPTLIAAAGKKFDEMVDEICKIVDGPVSVEAVSSKTEDIILEARKLSAISPKIVVKIPITIEGIKAVKVLEASGIKTNVTLVFSIPQALLAASVGATFVSPFLGRLDDICLDGIQLLKEMVNVFKIYQFETQIIAASIRHPLHIVEVAKTGVPIVTVPFKVLKQIFYHPLTDVGIQRFLKDWQKIS